MDQVTSTVLGGAIAENGAFVQGGSKGHAGATGRADMTIHGGAGGVRAHCEDLDQLASRTEDLGGGLALVALRGHQMLVDLRLLLAAPLDPLGWALFETELLEALDGPGGLSALVAGLGARAAGLRTAAIAYRARDEGREAALQGVGRLAGSLPLPTLGAAAAAYGVGDALGLDLSALVAEHPGIAIRAGELSPGVLRGLLAPWVPGGILGAAHGLSLLYRDGQPVVADLGVDPEASAAPGGFGDLFAALDRRAGAPGAGSPGQIDVRVVTGADGARAYIVDIPGTRSWELNPWQDRRTVNDFGTNVHAIDRQTTAYERGVAEALRRAGATAVDPVMLVGHSQGGIIAASAALHFVASGEFAVTHVVAAGAPIGHLEIPDSVQILSLENALDVVPHLDAATNPDQPNRTTVSFAAWTEDPHGLKRTYAPAAAELDRSDHPSVRAFRDSAAKFFGAGGEPATTYVYELSRVIES